MKTVGHQRRLKRSLLYAAQAVLHWTGVGALYVRARRANGAVILMYHSVAGDDAGRWLDPRSRVCAERFEAQMRYLARRRHVVSMTELVEAIEADGELQAGTVALTFDDGYRDNADVASPILAKHGLPWTLYLPTGYISEGEAQWIDQLHTMFMARTRDELSLDDWGLGRPDLRSSHTSRTAYQPVADRLLGASQGQRAATCQGPLAGGTLLS